MKVVQWAPQQDVLAHAHTRVFVTHGGLLSLQVSANHSSMRDLLTNHNPGGRLPPDSPRGRPTGQRSEAKHPQVSSGQARGPGQSQAGQFHVNFGSNPALFNLHRVSFWEIAVKIPSKKPHSLGNLTCDFPDKYFIRLMCLPITQ